MIDFNSVLHTHMQVRYDLSPDDILAISKQAPKGTNFHNMQVAIMTIVGILFMLSDIILLLFFVFLNDPSIRVPDIGPSLLIKIIVWFVIIGIVWSVLMLVAKRSIKALTAKPPGANGLFCEHLIEIDDEGFTESTDVNRSFHSWRSVETVRETDSYVLIEVRISSTYFIPKRAFDSDLQRNEFVTTVADHINRANIPQPPSFTNGSTP